MRLDERGIAAAAALFAIFGIALILVFSETPHEMRVAEALIAQEKTLVSLSGTAMNVSGGRFLICDSLCVSVRAGGMASYPLVAEGNFVSVTGRMKEYMGRKYVEAEKLEAGG